MCVYFWYRKCQFLALSPRLIYHGDEDTVTLPCASFVFFTSRNYFHITFIYCAQRVAKITRELAEFWVDIHRAMCQCTGTLMNNSPLSRECTLDWFPPRRLTTATFYHITVPHYFYICSVLARGLISGPHLFSCQVGCRYSPQKCILMDIYGECRYLLPWHAN